MAVNYKRELERAAKNMIMIHHPKTLVKMILRIIVKKVKVNHAIILLRRPDKDRDKYALTFFGQFAERKIPANQSVLTSHNPLIRFFKENRHGQIFHDGVVVYGKAKKLLEKYQNKKIKKALNGLVEQMGLFSTVVSIPSYFKDELLGVLLLGEKNNKKQFSREELNFFLALSSDVTMAIRNAQLFEKLQKEVEKNKNFFINTTVALTTAIDAKDHYTHGHTARVTEYTLLIAKRLITKNAKKFDEKFLDNLYIASLLHDIGKIGVPEFILNKVGPLEPEERKKMEEHPQIGVLILQPIKEIEDSILGVKYHHERYDGSGYPEGLKEGEIPLIASIISVADAFDAMTTNRPYRAALTKEEAIRQLKINCHSQFNPKVVEIIEGLYREGNI